MSIITNFRLNHIMNISEDEDLKVFNKVFSIQSKNLCPCIQNNFIFLLQEKIFMLILNYIVRCCRDSSANFIPKGARRNEYFASRNSISEQ
ncbi:hypothetical protein HMPREF7215_1942 [Pyramidobacter piscolens W5455]|uniref:Uncharacterized protein n=1 Tax=Pyramidobacter piscolens W5455 TaxID=352165 RepID=A0ABM9ZU92_9BACT|nr:hypothetical protein HMPREF7215_1942 [Pyramidobacter piscolens W5455]